MNVFIARDGETIGEYPREELEEMARNGELLPDDDYWHDGMDGWLPLDELLPPEAFEPPPPPPPPPNYRLIFGLGAGVLLAVLLVGFLVIRPDRIYNLSPTSLSNPSPTPEPLSASEVRDRAAAELQAMEDRLPKHAQPPLNTLYYDVTLNMNRELSRRAPWSAIIRGRENTIDPQSGTSISQADFTVTAEYEDGSWVYTGYRASVSGAPSEIVADETAPPSIVGLLGLKTRSTGSISIKIPASN